MAKVKIGEPYTFTPDAFVGELATDGERILHQVEGRIVYIHSQHRFFTAEGQVNGHTIRESFPITSRDEIE